MDRREFLAGSAAVVAAAAVPEVVTSTGGVVDCSFMWEEVAVGDDVSFPLIGQVQTSGERIFICTGVQWMEFHSDEPHFREIQYG